MMKRTFTMLLAVGMAALFGLLSPATAGAATAEAPTESKVRTVLISEDVTASSSPDCSTTKSWGKIRYQVCIRYNCDSTTCLIRGYLGLVNTAESPRTVDWLLNASNDPDGNRNEYDDHGTFTLAAKQQVTIFADLPAWTSPCSWWDSEWLWVKYGGTDWSTEPAHVKSPTPCV